MTLLDICGQFRKLLSRCRHCCSNNRPCSDGACIVGCGCGRSYSSVSCTVLEESRWKKLLALLCIAAIVFVWLAMAELVQDLEAHYLHPYFLTFVAHGMYVIFLAIWLIWRFSPFSESSNGNYVGYFNWCYYFGTSIPIGICAFISGWCWYESLPRTSVSGNTAIYQSSCAIVYVVSVVVLHEEVTVLKSISVVTSICGVFLVSFCGGLGEPTLASVTSQATARDGNAKVPLLESHSKPSLSGYMLCFVSMVLYAVFEVFYKKWASHSADPVPFMNCVRFLGLMGASTLLFCSTPLLFFDLFEYERFSWPDGRDAEIIIVLGILDSLFNLFLLLAIMLSSPLFASVGCLMVLPASVVWDSTFHNYNLPHKAMLGVFLIIAGFAGFCVAEYFNKKPYFYEVVQDNEQNSNHLHNIQHKNVHQFNHHAHTKTQAEKALDSEVDPKVVGLAINAREKCMSVEFSNATNADFEEDESQELQTINSFSGVLKDVDIHGSSK